MQRTICGSVMGFILFASSAVSSFATSLGPPASPKDFVGVWQGYASQDIEFIRLELNRDGTGRMALRELPNTLLMLYWIRWQQSAQGSYTLVVRTTASDPSAEPVELRSVAYNSFALTFRLLGKDWYRDFTAVSENRLQTDNLAAKKALRKLLRNK